MKRISLAIAILLLCGFRVFAQHTEQNHAERFEQLQSSLRSPNVYRTASGAPGHMYWQQKADHEIVVELNDENQSIKGWQKVSYHNYSPDPLSYLWIQLDQNERAKDSNTPKVAESKISQNMSINYDMYDLLKMLFTENLHNLYRSIYSFNRQLNISPEYTEQLIPVEKDLLWGYYIKDCNDEAERKKATTKTGTFTP